MRWPEGVRVHPRLSLRCRCELWSIAVSDGLGNRPTRREFLRAVARNAALGAIAACCAVLMTRKGGLHAGDACSAPAACGRCAVLASCALPRAIEARRDKTKA